MAVNATNFHVLHIPDDSAVFSGADVNGTKFHLLLNRTDWKECTSGLKGETLGEIWEREEKDPALLSREFDWNRETNEINLQQHLFRFVSSPKDEKPNLENRRGAARDRYGNWYWIDESGTKINVLSVGSNRVSDYYPVAASDCEQAKTGDFQPLEAKKETPSEFRGLAVTIDHYLVVGTIQPAGLLVFDLFSVGEPRQILWRGDVDFQPFDISARHCGGVFVLDRKHSRYWTLDRGFNAIPVQIVGQISSADDFQPLNKANERLHSQNLSAENFFSKLPEKDPISIEALPDDTVLILNLPTNEDFPIIYRYYRMRQLNELKTDSIKPLIKDDEKILSPSKRFTLRGYDIAFVKGDENEGALDRLFIVTDEGNQAFAFDLICGKDLIITSPESLPTSVVKKDFKLDPVRQYFPMRLYSGKGFAAADGKVYFDFGDRWLPLIKQNRPSFATFGILETPIFDGKEANCVWHRLLIDACISGETKIEVFSRSAADQESLALLEWQPEPPLYLRGNGSELAFVADNTSKEKGKGTWELLFQRAKSRFLQLQLVFSGNGQRTPRVSALRVYYPRFSYLNNYLPSIYRDDEQSAFFLDRFLANFEGFYTTIEERIAAAQMLFDVRSAPTESLDWLAKWFGVVLDPAWNEEKRRLFIRHAVEFFQFRGTMHGLRIALRLVLDSCADENIFKLQTAAQKLRDPIRIVERFQTLLTPEIIPADSAIEQNQPRIIRQTLKWQPSHGADVLHQRYQQKLDDKTDKKFLLMKPSDTVEATIWEKFAVEVLGFVPSNSAAKAHNQWQGFLRNKYSNSIEKLNQKHATNYSKFSDIFLPNGTETNLVLKDYWQDFIDETIGLNRNWKLWQDFLARRYRRIGQMNLFYGTKWDSFELVAPFDQLPFAEKSLTDWYQFEGSVLPMHQTAHRFTVLIPAIFNGGIVENSDEQNRKLELVRRVVDLEKPAHTVCDFRFYWNLFRLNEVRLGFDTLLGLGSRDPQLNPLLVAGQNYVGESHIGVSQPEKYASRYVLGNESLIKKKKDEKP